MRSSLYLAEGTRFISSPVLYAAPYPRVQCPAYTNSSSSVNYMQYTTNLSWLRRLRSLSVEYTLLQEVDSEWIWISYPYCKRTVAWLMQLRDTWIKFVSYQTSRLSNNFNLHLFYIIPSLSYISSNSLFFFIIFCPFISYSFTTCLEKIKKLVWM
jgi:hypothetical protein